MTTKGQLLVIDGPDGAGKTTALNYIKNALTAKERKFKTVNVLSTQQECLRMRTILTDPASTLSQRAELLLYAAAITNCYDTVIQPFLDEGVDVVVDRGPLSNFAYQLQDVSHELFQLWLEIHKRFKCDATFIITVDLQKGLERCKQRDGVLDRVESRPIEFHQKMMNAYLQVTNNPLLFNQITGDVTIYCNNGTLVSLVESCVNFVQGVFPTSEVVSEALLNGCYGK